MPPQTKRNPLYLYIPIDDAVPQAQALLNTASRLSVKHPDLYSDWSEVLTDATMRMRHGFDSTNAPSDANLDELVEDNRAFAKNIFDSVSNALSPQFLTNPASQGSPMTTAKFPGQSCVVCGAEFVPGTTQIEVHPTITGPKGGKKYVHSNPSECSAHSNPYAATNAGRRTMWDANAAGGARSVPKPGRPAAFKAPVGKEAGREMAYIHRQDLLGMSARELRNLGTSALEGVAETVLSELDRRQRGPTGRKTAWGEGPAPKFANVKARA